MIQKTAAYSNALMALTSIHHIYGAYIYDTPWRLHVLALSIPVMILNWYAAKKGAGNTLILYTFGLANLIMSIVLIGIFEGMYNHVAKNVLYFSELNDSTMTRLFPPPTYVMPNDFFFELTGIAQGLLAIPLLYFFIKWFGVKKNKKL